MVFPGTRDFVLTQNSDGVTYGAIWMIYESTPDFEGWIPKFDPSNPLQRASDFLSARYAYACAASFDKRRRELFILDAGGGDLANRTDSVFKFDRLGQFKTESFGHYKTISSLFHGLDHPRGVAYSTDCTLYIADTGNKVIRRFRLSTQTSCN
jgi:hypothetical protein